MKKLIIFAIPLFIIFAYFQNSYARSYYKSYVISQIQSDGIVLRDFKGAQYLIKEDPGDLKVGDHVRYSKRWHSLKKSQWQPATITQMTDRKLTLKLNSGKELDINMRMEYRGKFKQNDQILYNESAGQIKENKFQELGEE